MQTLRGNATGEDGEFASTQFIHKLRGEERACRKYIEIAICKGETPGAGVEEKKVSEEGKGRKGGRAKEAMRRIVKGIRVQ